jgi:hypothetical protein
VQQELSELKHYWKIRCAERKTLSKKSYKLKLLISRLEHLEKNLSEFTNRKHFIIRSFKDHKTKKDDQCYPLFLSHYEYNRLKIILKTPGKMGRPRKERR